MDYGADFHNFGIWPFDPWYQGKSHEQIATIVFEEYLKFANKFNRETNTPLVTTKPEAFLSKYGNTINQIADGIALTKMDKGDMQTGVIRVAKVYKGAIPPNVGVFLQGFQDQLTASPVLDVMVEVQAPVRKVLSHADEALTQSTGLAKNINKYFPYVLGVIGVGIGAYGLSQLSFIANLFTRKSGKIVVPKKTDLDKLKDKGL